MKIAFLAIITMFLIGGFIACKSPSGTTSVTKRDKGEEEFNKYLEMKKGKFINKPIPSQLVNTIYGKQYNPAQMKGKIVVLNFWFAACKPCITEIPSLNELQSKYKSKGLVVLSVSTDPKIDAKVTAEAKKMEYKVGYDGKEFAGKMEVTSYPTTFLIDQKGIVREVFIGASSFDATQTYTEIKPHIEKLLQK